MNGPAADEANAIEADAASRRAASCAFAQAVSGPRLTCGWGDLEVSQDYADPGIDGAGGCPLALRGQPVVGVIWRDLAAEVLPFKEQRASRPGMAPGAG